MNLAFDLGDGTALRLVDATVFAIGANEKYIVVQQHPATDTSGHFDRSVTTYWIVERTQSADVGTRQKGVRGPFTELEFQKMATTLSLPPFTKTFEELK